MPTSSEIGSEIRGGYATVAGARTFYDTCGDGVPLVCIHTGGADARVYHRLMPLLAERGYRVVAPDLPGHGRSLPAGPEVPNRVHEQAEFVHEFVEAISGGGGGESTVVFGASLGGLLVLDLAANHPTSYRGLIAFQAASWMPTFPPADELERPSWLPGWSDLFERLALDGAGSGLAGDDRREELRWLHRACPQQVGSRDATAWAVHDIRGDLGPDGCPILLGHGTDDFLVPKELVALTRDELGARARFVELDGLGHYPMIEDPDQVATLVDDFVSGLPEARDRS